ncbi:DUF4199 domain-containing protein [Poritiphilus flavus]|uniref:DUF4199 family protein n=1 Tax=Poritiphilus flavus TaxID=2697053 RepID=A0A6L9EA54_9FLAO|nr:DUF4199 domain-containing protein [Poritiphilus flavus]NAS11441.1 DUF4199 family protein [Poritiphilus flavus]
MKGYILKYGIAGGLISSILGTLNWLMVAQSIGVSASQALGYISITLSLLCIPFGVRYFRDKLNKGAVSFGQAFLIGMGITGIAALVMAIHSMLFFAFQREEFIAWQRQDLSPAELAAFNEQLAQMPEFAYTPWFQGIVMFFMVFLIGAVVNLISALLLKKEGRPLES